MPDYGDITGGLPPYPIDAAPDLASLQYPWSEPAALPPNPTAAALPVLGPQPEGAPPPAMPPPELAPEAAPVPGPATVAEMPDISITTEAPAAPAAAPPPAPLGSLPPGVAGPTISPAEAHYQQTAKDYAGNPLAIPDDAERQRALDSLDPFQLADVNADFSKRRDAFIAERRKHYADADAEAARQHLEGLKAAYADTQLKMDQTLADAQRIADTKIDPSGGVHGARLLAGVVASVFGGLVQGRTGSARNAGLDALESTINRGIEAQKAEIANKRGAIDLKRNVLAAEFARHGDMYQAEEAVRLASWKHVDDLLAFDQQNYDQRGATALLRANQRRQIAAVMQQQDAARRQKFLENNLKVQDAARQQQIADETARHNRAGEYLDMKRIESEAANRADARAARQADKEAERADKEAERDRQFAIGGTAHVQVDDKGKPVIGPDGKPAISYDDLRNADGSRWRAASPEETSKLREKKTAATQLTKLYDRVLAIRDRVGGESKWGNSDDYQELKGLEKEILLLKKQGTQGMSSDADMENLAGAAGADDVTSFRARAAGLKAARARTVDTLNQSFRDARYTGPALVFPEPEPAKNTPEDDKRQALLQKPNETLDDLAKREIDSRIAATGRGYGYDPTDPADRALRDEAIAAARAKYDPGASVDQRANIDALAKQAAGGGEQAAAAAKVLQSIAREADTARLQGLARDALQRIEDSKKPAPRGPSSAPLDIPEELKLGIGVR